MHKANKTRGVKLWLLSILVLLSAAGSALIAQDGESNGFPGNRPQPQFTERGAEGCLLCHQGDKIVLMAETAHGNRDNPHTPYSQQACESCHGPGSFHVSRARGGVGFPPLTSFRPRMESKALQDQSCTQCHEKRMGSLPGIAWYGSHHQDIGLTCLSCHELHVAADPMADMGKQNHRCSQCHRRALEEHDRFENAGIRFDDLSCATCHDVHEF